MGVKVRPSYSSAVVEIAEESVEAYVAAGWVEVEPEVKKQDAKPSSKK